MASLGFGGMRGLAGGQRRAMWVKNRDYRLRSRRGDARQGTRAASGSQQDIPSIHSAGGSQRIVWCRSKTGVRQILEGDKKPGFYCKQIEEKIKIEMFLTDCGEDRKPGCNRFCGRTESIGDLGTKTDCQTQLQLAVLNNPLLMLLLSSNQTLLFLL